MSKCYTRQRLIEELTDVRACLHKSAQVAITLENDDMWQECYDCIDTLTAMIDHATGADKCDHQNH